MQMLVLSLKWKRILAQGWIFSQRGPGTVVSFRRPERVLSLGHSSKLCKSKWFYCAMQQSTGKVVDKQMMAANRHVHHTDISLS